MSDLRYPVGEFQLESDDLTDEQRRKFIQQIADAPVNMRAAIKELSEKQLDTPYRPEGWTVRQVVHHVPDSHMNAYNMNVAMYAWHSRHHVAHITSLRERMGWD